MSGAFRRLAPLGLLLALAIVLGLATAALRYGPSTPAGRDAVVSLVNGLKVGRLGRLRIEGLRGDPWRDFTLDRLVIDDGQGAWLDARDLAVSWRPLELLARHVRIASLRARIVTLARPPRLSAPEPESPLPVTIRIDAAATRLALRPALAVREGLYDVDGALQVGRRATLRGRVRAVSLLHAGDRLDASYNFGGKSIFLDAHAREATGGALAGFLGLDAAAPFTLDAAARGTPREGWFDLASASGPATPVSARGRWTRAGGSATGRVDLMASRLLAPWRDGVGPQAGFDLTARQVKGDLYDISVTARASNVALTLRGEADTDKQRTGPRGLAVNLAVADLSKLVGQSGLGAARVDGQVTGQSDHWRLDGAAALERYEGLGMRLRAISGPFHVESDRQGFVAKADLKAVGDPTSGLVGGLLGVAPHASAELDRLAGGRLLLRRLLLQGAAVQATGEGEVGLFGGMSFHGQGRMDAHMVSDSHSAGQLTADWRAAQANPTSPWTFALQAQGKGLKLADPDADHALGPTPSLSVTGRLERSGALSGQARLSAAGGVLNGAGALGPSDSIQAAVDWTSKGTLTLGPLRISGPTHGNGTLSGVLAAPRVDLQSAVGGLEVSGVPIPGLHDGRVALSLTRDGPAAVGPLTFAATGPGGLTRGAGQMRWAANSLSFSDIDTSGGGLAATGSVTFDDHGVDAADLRFTVSQGAFLEAGHLEGRYRIAHGPGGGRGALDLTGSGVRVTGSGVTLDKVSLNGEGTLERLPFHLAASGAIGGMRARLDGTGAATQTGDNATIEFNGAGRFGRTDLRTVAPIRVVLAPAGVSADLRVAAGTGTVEAHLTSSEGGLSARGALANFDMALFDPDIVGRANAAFDLRSQGEVLTGHALARVVDVAGRDLKGAAALSGAVEASIGPRTIDFTAELSDTGGSKASAQVTLPAKLSTATWQVIVDTHQPITGRFSAGGAVGPLWDLLEGGGRTLNGRVAASGSLGGTLADPQLSGAISLADGVFVDAATGLRLEHMAVEANLKGESVEIGRLSASDGAKGSLSGSGVASLARDGASTFKISLKDFRLIDSPLGVASASGDITVNRASDGHARLSGDLVVDHAQISPKPPTPSGVVPMEVVEVNRPAESDESQNVSLPPAPPVALDIRLRAPGGVIIKGRGLNLELSLDARVTGDTANPDLSGVARVVRGDYDFAGKRFQIDDGGSVHLASTPQDIRLDLSATRDDPTLTARIQIQGTAAAPTLTLSSTPALPRDEILSQILFGSSAAQLSGFQAAQLASTLAGLASGGGFDVMGGLRNFAHLDRLAIDSGATTGVTVAGGKYLTNNIYVELSGGSRAGEGAQVEWRIKKHIALVSRATSQGDRVLSIRWRTDY